MWTAIVQAFAWLAGTKAGRIVAAVAGAIMGALLLRAKWRADGAADQRAEAAKDTIKTQERVNEAGVAYRADGAARRMRDGTF